jgi:hypothetical protein
MHEDDRNARSGFLVIKLDTIVCSQMRHETVLS